MGEQIAGAVVPSLISGIMGSDEPSYQQPSMDQIMTPLQKELSPILLDQAKRSDQYAKLFEGQLPKNQAYFNQQKSNYLSGSPTTATTNPTTVPTTNTTSTTAPTTPFATSDLLEEASKIYESRNPAKGRGINNYWPTDGGGLGSVSSNAAIGLQQGTITKEMIEAYKRQKQAANDAALLAKGVN